MKVALLTRDAPEQVALCYRVAGACELAGVVVSRNLPRRPSPDRWRILWNRVQGRVFGRPFLRAWFNLQEHYRHQHSTFPDVRTVRVANVNDPETLRLLEQAKPDLICISSTNLVGEAVIRWASRRSGVINLHTGLSPYVKGGPNCTNWCLAERSFHLIGNTVLWLDLGIDSGPILTSELTPLTGREDLTGLHLRVQEHAQALYVRAIEAVRDGFPVSRCEQDQVAPGKTYYTRDWNGCAMRGALRNFRTHYTPAYFASLEYRQHREGVRTIALPTRG